MPKLKLLDIRCVKHGETGGDEPYLKVGGNKVWAHNDMKGGMMFSLRSLGPYPFREALQIELMEKDSFRDDQLGSASVYWNQVGMGQLELNFTEGGAHYQIIYEVLPD